jgi:hypothetical protein
MPSPKVFVSHSHVDYDKAMWIKEDLERYGLEVFVAHRDITPSLEWRNEIVGQIKSCDLFVALLTFSYKDSHWCDQECGIAFANSKPMLPVAIELMPYGFLESYQALIWDPTDIRKSRANMIRAILSGQSIPTELVVAGVVTSDSFAEAGEALGILLRRGDLTDEQIHRVATACFKNTQIIGSSTAQKLVPEFYQKYSDRLPPNLRARFARELGGDR